MPMLRDQGHIGYAFVTTTNERACRPQALIVPGELRTAEPVRGRDEERRMTEIGPQRAKNAKIRADVAERRLEDEQAKEEVKAFKKTSKGAGGPIRDGQ